MGYEDKDYFYGLNADGPVPLATPQAKDCQATKLREAIGVILCLAFFAAIVGLYSYSREAHAAKPVEIPLHVYEDAGTVIRLMPGPCVERIVVAFLESAAPAEASRFRRIESTWTYRGGQRKSHAGCWAEFSAQEAGADEPILIMFFDDGERLVVKKREFLRGNGAGT